MGNPLKRYQLLFSKFDKAIIALAFLFFPLAMVLAGIRIAATHRHNSRKGRNYRLAGWVLVVAFLILELLIIIGSIGTDDTVGLLEATIFLGIVFLVPAAVLFRTGSKRDRRFGMLLEVYADAIVRERLTHIPFIAQAAGQTPEHATRDVNEMFRMRLLPLGKIEQGTVIIPSLRTWEDRSQDERFHNLGGQADEALRQAAAQTKQREEDGPHLVECPGCGAKSSVIRGEHKECDYCGTMLRHSRIG